MGFGIYPKKIPNTRPFTSHLPETTKTSLLIYGVYQGKLEEKPEGRLHNISRYGDPERVLQQVRLILSGKLSPSQIGIGFPVSFTYFLLMSGFSEEFLFRVFIQTRCSLLLKSKIGGVLISPLLFGLPHFSGIMWWYPGTKLVQAFCRAFFVQTFMGILLGILWERTRSLIPGVILHSGINGLNNLGWIVSRFGF